MYVFTVSLIYPLMPQMVRHTLKILQHFEDYILVITVSTIFTNFKLVQNDMKVRHDQSFISFKPIKPCVHKLDKHMLKNLAAFAERFLTSV